MTRTLASLALVASLTSACQTRRQSTTVAVIGLSAAVIGGAVTYSARNDDGGPPIVFPLAVLVGGGIAIISAFHAITADE
jgi:hypothetical protein